MKNTQNCSINDLKFPWYSLQVSFSLFISLGNANCKELQNCGKTLNIWSTVSLLLSKVLHRKSAKYPRAINRTTTSENAVSFFSLMHKESFSFLCLLSSFQEYVARPQKYFKVSQGKKIWRSDEVCFRNAIFFDCHGSFQRWSVDSSGFWYCT